MWLVQLSSWLELTPGFLVPSYTLQEAALTLWWNNILYLCIFSTPLVHPPPHSTLSYTHTRFCFFISDFFGSDADTYDCDNVPVPPTSHQDRHLYQSLKYKSVPAISTSTLTDFKDLANTKPFEQTLTLHIARFNRFIGFNRFIVATVDNGHNSH